MAVYVWLYGRVSEEERDGSSVPGQIAHLKSLAAIRNWKIVRIVTEPAPVSASEYSIKARKGYQSLVQLIPADIARIRRTDPDAQFILAAREDTRISRRPIEREQLMELCRSVGCWFNFGGTDYDPSNPDARLTLRITGATAAHTSDMTAYKVSTRVLERVRDGRPHGKMPIIYKRRCDPETGKTIEWILDPVPARACREAIEAILECRSGADGHSVSAAAVFFRAETGRNIPTQQFRRMIMLPTLAGIRMHNGEEVGTGNWPAIITPLQHRMLVEILSDESRLSNTRGTKPKNELSYIAICGKCNQPELAPSERKTATKTYRMYKCRNCNKLGVIAEPLELLVRAAMFKLLSDERVVAAMNEESDDESAMALRVELAQTSTRLDEFYASAAAGRLSARGLQKIEAELLPRIEELKAEIDRLPVGGSILRRYVGEDAPRLWDTWPIDVRRALIRTALEIVVLPSQPGKRFTPDRVDIRWRV